MAHQNNEQNLVPFSSDTEEQARRAREIGAKGGRASAESKKKKKNMRELLNLILNLPVSQQNKVAMERLGITATEDQTNKTMVLLGLLKRAEQGDPRAVGMIAGISGDLMPEQEDIPTKLEISFIDASGKDKEDGNS